MERKQTDNDNTPRLRFDRHEAAGALGDLGTFIPLLVGMVTICGLQLGPALVAAGAMNIATGLLFRIPMPVQPMKAIAAVAIAESLNASQIVAAGVITGAVVLLLGVTGLIDLLNRAVPRSVVRGLQLALGLKLLAKGGHLVVATNTLIGWDSIGTGVICLALVLLLWRSRRFPSALAVFILGFVALFAADSTLFSQLRLGVDWQLPNLTNPNDWGIGFWRGAVPQVPLTTLNSVISVCALSVDLFPKRSANPRRVAISVGLMNLICCPLGAMPMCHGAGGLASQHRFGARTGGSVVMLGVVKMILGGLFGASMLAWLQAYPKSVLGVLLMFGGLELARMCRDQKTPANLSAMLITAIACLATNTAAGFAIGWTAAIMLMLALSRFTTSPTTGR